MSEYQNARMMLNSSISNMPMDMRMNYIPNFGLSPNDNRQMFINMLYILNSNPCFNSNPYFNPNQNLNPGNLHEYFSQDRIGNQIQDVGMNPILGTNMVNNAYSSNYLNKMNNNNNMNIYPNNNCEQSGINNFSSEKKDVKRDENLDVKMDVDNILKAGIDLDSKNIDVQHILNYIPFTIIKDTPKEIKNRPHCLICLDNFEVNQKVSAIPCCHCFHTKCLDDRIISRAKESKYAKCPVCNFEITLRNLIGEYIIKKYMKK